MGRRVGLLAIVWSLLVSLSSYLVVMVLRVWTWGRVAHRTFFNRRCSKGTSQATHMGPTGDSPASPIATPGVEVSRELQNQFDRAAELIAVGKPKKPNATNADKAAVYSWYKQATCGDVIALKPGVMQVVAR